MAEKGKRRAAKWTVWILLCTFAGIMVLPLLMLCADSLMGSRELAETCGAVLADQGEWAGFRFFPDYPTLRAYVRLLLDSPEYFTAFWNSMLHTMGVLAGQLLTAVPAAWAFARFRFPGKKMLWFLYMLLMILPFQVTMVSGYLVLSGAQLMDTHGAVILPGIFSTLPVFILRKTFAGLPGEVVEAARLDGAGNVRIFLNIGIPLGMPGIFSILILGFLEYWSLIEQPLAFLEDQSLWPLSLYLPEITWAQAGYAFTASIITLIPAVFVFVWGQDYLEQGIIFSGLKE